MYALFCNLNIMASENLNTTQLKRQLLDNQQQSLMNQETAVSMDLCTAKMNASKELSALYEKLADESLSDAARSAINSQVQAIQNKLQLQEQSLNLQTQELGMQENGIESQSKSLESQITKLSKEIENIEDAEKDAIENATPQYKGLG